VTRTSPDRVRLLGKGFDGKRMLGDDAALSAPMMVGDPRCAELSQVLCMTFSGALSLIDQASAGCVKGIALLQNLIKYDT
jgi:hypothetical protein